jgi:hypothetical protein
MVAVLSGDIIHSSKLDPKIRQELFKRLEIFLKDLMKKDKQFKAETNRGDWFQCLTKNPQNSLRYALLIKSFLRSLRLAEEKDKSIILDARIANGIGNMDFEGDRLGNSDGSSFHVSGRLLETLKGTSKSLAAATEKNEEVNEQWFALLTLVDFIVSKTTSSQCEVIQRKLQGFKETEIAKELSILQSAVNQRSSASGWNPIDIAVKQFEKTIIQLS